MKTTRTLLVFAGTIFAAALVQAQTVFVSVDRQEVFRQTDDGTTAAAPYSAGTSGPNVFVVAVEGNDGADVSGISAPEFERQGNPGLIALTPSGSNWRKSYYYPDGASLTSAYPNGTYSVFVDGNQFELTLSGDIQPVTPSVTITGGSYTWAGSGVATLYVTPGTNLTFTSNAFSNWETNGAQFNHIGGFLLNGGTEVSQAESFSDNADAVFGTGTGNPNYVTFSYEFNTGNYLLELEFNAVVSVDTLSPVVGADGVGIAIYTSRTTFNIQVIPEFATCAEIFGVVALVGAMVHRRRRLA